MSRAGSKKFSSSQKLEEEEGKESKRRPVSLGVQQPNQNRSCQPQARPSAGSAKESADRRKDKLPVLTDRISHLGISNSSSRRNSCGPSSNSIPLPSSNTKIPLRRSTSNSSSSSIRGTVDSLLKLDPKPYSEYGSGSRFFKNIKNANISFNKYF